MFTAVISVFDTLYVDIFLQEVPTAICLILNTLTAGSHGLSSILLDEEDV